MAHVRPRGPWAENKGLELASQHLDYKCIIKTCCFLYSAFHSKSKGGHNFASSSTVTLSHRIEGLFKPNPPQSPMIAKAILET